MFNPFSGRGLVAGLTLGGSELLGENTMSKIPGLNAIGGYQSDEAKALLAKQQEMAAEARKRQEANAQSRLTALGQQMLAFAPRNQLMAQVFGPQAAFSPQQMQAMTADPRPKQAWGSGSDQDRIDQVTRKRGEQQRQQMFAQNFQQPQPQAPAPFGMPGPQAARRF